MKQVLIKQGQAVVEDVPAPGLEPDTVLVRVDHSCISVGTEMVGVRATGAPLWKRVMSAPGEKIKRLTELVTTHGVSGARAVVEGALSASSPTGYSAAGVVVGVGAGIDDLAVGDRVACAGAQCAHHAERIRVPRNLTVPIPDTVDFADASTVTLGAIALQGVRRATPTLGENFVVIGLGVLGQLTVQLLRANGCRVIGVDLDRNRLARAQEMGMEVGLHPEDGDEAAQVARLTEGIGADGVIITAATPSDAVMSTAFKMCRRKGRVVLVGDVGLNLNRADFYAKELDFFISTSYGPGRYDARYEEQGLDYPVAYVRWTENRNMAEFLRLIADGRVHIKPLVEKVYPLQEATRAYESLKGDARPLMILLSYPQQTEADPTRRVPNPAARPVPSGVVRMAVAGAGGFARGTHLPNIQTLHEKVRLHAVMSRTGHNANSTAKQYGASYATTDYAELLRDPELDAILIATRHNLHAEMTLAALKAGKHVLVEKPLTLTLSELQTITEFYEQETVKPPLLLTGFNRRFSPYARRIQELIAGRSNPMILNYRMNAGYLPLDHWVHTMEGGGRNRGEACHIYDLFTFLTGSRVTAVKAHALTPRTSHYSASDNFVASMTFEDGSVATLTYTALGAKDYPKEHLEVYVDGKVLVLEDYRKLMVYGAKARGVETPVADKGQKAELLAFVQALQTGEWPIPLWQQVQATEIACQVEQDLTATA